MRWCWCVAAAVASVAAVGCGESFSASGGGGSAGTANTTGVGGNMAGVTSGGGAVVNTGGSGGASMGNGGGGNVPVRPPCLAGQVSSGAAIMLHTTLDSLDAAETPAVPQAAAGSGTLDDGTFVPGLQRNGLKLDGEGQRLRYPGAPTYLNAPAGTVDFCFRPLHASTDGKKRYFLTARGVDFEWLGIFKNAAGHLVVRLGGPNTGDFGAMLGTVEDIGYEKDQWHRLTVSWSTLNEVIAVYLDGAAQGVAMSGSLMNISPLVGDTEVVIGDVTDGGDDTSPKSVIDELYVYGGFVVPSVN